ncbi:hypothetical protein [Posidoniimonas corsicana]|uniref:hypothetical protein n=1 Tax=Posidoniimonas corsicana TaxID=1938618 RepID=UPI0011B4B4C4|nr:hypothetical protein [Posidoniimonas corsicana]
MALLAAATTANAADIGWITFHAADNAPSAGAAGAGFTEAPDKGFTDLLSSAGHNVTRFLTTDDPDVSVPAENGADSAAYLSALNSMDLVIIGRSISSSHYQGGNETAWWNTQVTSPLMAMSGWTLRTSRLNYTTGTTMVDIAGPTSLEAVDPSHPIFDGFFLSGANETGAILDLVGAERGTSINTEPIVASGNLIARVSGDDGDGATLPGGPVIAEWPTGATLGNGDITGGPRMLFIAGTREADGVSSETAGLLDLTADGQTLFLSAVDYMTTVPEPSSALLVLCSLVGAGFARTRN